jgi:DNA polymerase-1
MPRLAQKFIENPELDIHGLIAEWTSLERVFAKNVNFCKLFGGGPEKVSKMCGISLQKGKTIVNKYDREFPEAKVLMDMAQEQARRIGFVRTILGRRRRYDVNNDKERFYSALNAVLQGGMTGDLIKLKILHLYRERKRFGITMRATVHDELTGNIPDNGIFRELAEFMNEQELPLELPIVWESGTGKNWEEAH